MNDLYGLGMSGVPPEYQAQYRAMQQQQMMAQSLLAQSQDPLQNQAPGVAVSPTQGLAKMVQAYIGAKGMQNAAQGMQGAATKYNDDQSAAMNKVTQAMAPSPAVPIPMANATGVEGQMIPKTPAEQQAVVREALMNQFPNVRQYASTLNSNLQADKVLESQQAQQDKTFAENERVRVAAADLARQQKLEDIENAKVEEERRNKRDFEQTKQLKDMIKSGQAPSESIVIQTADGVMGFDKRTREVFPLKHNGKQLLGSTSNPELQGDIAGSKTGSEAKAKREFNMTGLGDTIQEADDLLSGKNGALPTGSGIGAARDSLGGFFGMSSEGSIQGQKLKALSGALTSKMPRMEGPQSDKDVAMYREMAAEIGDPTVPVARRQAALGTVKKLWAKYEPQNQAPAPANNGWSIRPIQ